MKIEIQSMKGSIAQEELGETMMHEHVFSDWRPELREKCIDYSRQELQKLQYEGADTVVDVGPWPERKIDYFQELAPQLDMNIIMSTGFYLQRRTPKEYYSWSSEQFEDHFTRELYEGIQGSAVRAALIKVAGDKAVLSDWEKSIMTAAGKVQAKTGVPICTHACEGARSQFDHLTKAGADPQRIYMCHIEAEFGWEGRNLQEEAKYLEAICREGGSLYFNNFEFQFDTPHEDMMYLMHYLCDKGYAHRVLFGMDSNFRFDENENPYWEAEREHPEAGVRSYAYTYTGAIPLMRRWGFTDLHFHTFLVENPRRLFSTTRI
jgi:phosphotriesterase-related protein